MRGIMFVEKGKAEFIEEPMPTCAPDTVLLKTVYSGVTNGTERNVLLGGNYGGSWPKSLRVPVRLSRDRGRRADNALCGG